MNEYEDIKNVQTSSLKSISNEVKQCDIILHKKCKVVSPKGSKKSQTLEPLFLIFS